MHNILPLWHFALHHMCDTPIAYLHEDSYNAWLLLALVYKAIVTVTCCSVMHNVTHSYSMHSLYCLCRKRTFFYNK